MRKTISTILSIIILFSLTACGGKAKKNEGDEYNPETDYPVMYESSISGTYITESPAGYYYLDGHFLFYADKKTMKSMPLCNKPNCKHLDETDDTIVYNCNAYLGVGAVLPFIQYYNGKIYTIEGFDSVKKVSCKNLIEISLDGSARKRLIELSDSSVYGIHRGYLYECVNGNKATVTKVPMNNLKAKPEIIFESKLDESNFYFNAKGRYVYLTDMGVIETEKATFKHVYCYDTERKICSQIITSQDENELFPNLFKSDNSTLLYSKANPNFDVSNANNRQIYSSDLAGKNEKLFKDFSNESNEINKYCVFLNSDGTYYYEEWINYMLDDDAQKAGKFIIYDKDFNKLYEGNKEWMPANHWFSYGGKNHMFINYTDNQTDKNMIVYAQKSDFANGKFELKTLSENTFQETHPRTKVEK